MNTRKIIVYVSLAAIVWFLITPSIGFCKDGQLFDKRPPKIREYQCTTYDGVTNDLLTGGLGASGLANSPPGVSDPPTAEELRTLAIYTNYRALIDMSLGGGYGTLYGPSIEIGGEGLVPGTECLAFIGKDNVTAMVQVPNNFDPIRPCIVTGPSSGSRGVYGAIGTTAGWAFQNGCAVAFTDKGTGTGFHYLEENTVSLIQGQRADAEDAGKDSNFTAKINDRQRQQFNNQTPDRFAFKHAHSRSNPEADWGHYVHDSIRFAFFILNELFNETILTPDNTIVIAAGVSNGGGSAVRAAEEDKFGLIDGLVVSEPNVTPNFQAPFTIMFENNPPFSDHSKSIFDYISYAAIYEGCANEAADPSAPLNFTELFFGIDFFGNRCLSLWDKGLLTENLVADLAAEARQKLLDFGFLQEQLIIDPSYWWLYLDPAVAAGYVNAYSRARVQDSLCGYSYGATDGNVLGTVSGTGRPQAIDLNVEAVIFGTSSGIPPTGGVELINNESVGGPLLDRVSISPSTGRQDENLDGLLCARSLLTGFDISTGAKLRGPLQGFHKRLVRSIEKVLLSGKLDGLPAIIIAGRNDALVAPNHAARAYYGFNQFLVGEASGLRYYEVTNAHHLDALNSFAGFDNRFIPLHHYFTESLDLMLAHLRNAEPLPPSQVVRTVQRGGVPGAAPQITGVNVPNIDPAPDGASIVYNNNMLIIPQ
jgi:hydroxybutyrate-dimer hydrolase